MSGLTFLPVCILDMFLAPGLISRLDDIPKMISLPKIEYKPMTSSSINFTGRRDYLTKLRAFFDAESDGPLIPNVANLPAGMHTRHFLAPGLIARLDDIPKTISLPYKPITPSSTNFTGRRDYLTKLRAYFNVGPNEPLRRKSFLLYGMGGIGKTQICLKFAEENLDM
jgi:hypothetical protein